MFRDPRPLSNYPDDYFKGPFAHEIGHVFQGTSQGLSDYGTDNGAFKEAFATVLRDVAKERLIGQGPARAELLRVREFFFRGLYQRQGFPAELDRDASTDLGWAYYFVLGHLTDTYGPQIHGEFARLWGDETRRRTWQSLADREQLSFDERICVLYSRICGRNLCGLFQTAGSNVAEGKVQRVLELVSK
jgi:hypothetical protein